jgi:hypothetical protein
MLETYMGSVIDFIKHILHRPDRPPPTQGGAIPSSTFDETALQAAIEWLDHAPPSAVIIIGPKHATSCLCYGHNRQKVAHIAMQSFPEAAWILSFDGDGYIREAALRRLSGPAHSSGRFIAIALRLNDWVPQIRAEAVNAASKIWPVTSAAIIAEAAPYLLKQRFIWRRWHEQERVLLDGTLWRHDVAAHLGQLFMNGMVGPLGSILRHALRFPSYDEQLVDLAFGAKLAAVRAVALKTLVDRRATWVIGHGWAWVDKVYGLRRRIPLLEHRNVSASEPEMLIRKGLADTSAQVRKIAISALIEHAADMPDTVEIAERLIHDPSPAVRDRANFLLRHVKKSHAASNATGE